MTDCSPGQCGLDFRYVLHRAPALSNETTLGHIQVEHVHGMIDGLHLTNLLRERDKESRRDH